MPRARIVRWGDSLAVRIPKTVAEELRLKTGDWVVIDASKGRIELHCATPTLEMLVAGITPDNRHRDTYCGPDVGKEVIEW